VNKNLIIIVVATCASFWTTPSHAKEQSQLILKEESQLIFKEENKSIFNEQSQLTFTGTVSPQCSFSMLNNTPASGGSTSFALLGNHGSITTVCNTASTLSVTIDKAASGINNSDPQIRFATGGTGIYTHAHQGSSYQPTAIFNSQSITSAIGDTAKIEVDLPAVNINPVIVYASLTPQ
jgi:hypothetical protein